MALTEAIERHEQKVPGRATVSVAIDADVTHVWKALTDARDVSQWFGEMSGSLRQGGRHRVDFGDGDFFELSEVDLNPPSAIRYRWRFLGTGPENLIGWSIQRIDGRTVVRVDDDEPDRGPDGISSMIEGWTDFLGRLRHYCETGQNARYDWRREFDAAIELDADAGFALQNLVFAPDGHRWLPWTPTDIAEGLTLRPKDSMAPSEFTIANLERHPDAAITFELGCPSWRAPTHCRLQIKPHGAGSIIVIAHNGWEGIDPSDDRQREQRERFGTLWIDALAQARAIVGDAKAATVRNAG